MYPDDYTFGFCLGEVEIEGERLSVDGGKNEVGMAEKGMSAIAKRKRRQRKGEVMDGVGGNPMEGRGETSGAEFRSAWKWARSG